MQTLTSEGTPSFMFSVCPQFLAVKLVLEAYSLRQTLQ